MNISIIGTGYVGLVTGACFAETGVHVTCVDIDKEKVEKLSKGVVPIYEPGLKEIFERNLHNERLRFTSNVSDNLEGSDIVFIAVGTPPGEDGSADLSYVLSVARAIGKHIKHYTVVVTKSTVPVGTATQVKNAVREELAHRGVDIPFDVVSNPEFLKEGAAVSDFLKPDRIVIGVESDRAEEILKKLYKPFTLNGHPIIFMDITSAEMTKYAANAMLATRISFINDISNLCEIVGANVDQVRKGIGSDPRIGHHFIFPGIGYGGSCFPKDVQALIKTAENNGYPLKVLSAVEEVNEKQKSILYRKAKKRFNGVLKDKTVAIWGLSFKPHTNDMREAPSLTIIDNLLKAGCKVKAYDPQAMGEAREMIGDRIEFSHDQYEALIEADILFIVTEWPEFRNPNFKVMDKLMREKFIFDGRNIYDAAEMKSLGFEYECMGR